MEEVMEKGQAGGVVVGRRKFWTLAYADDLVLVAKEEREMKEMMRTLERYLKKRKLTLNADKSKMMRFKNGGGGEKRVEWKWEERDIEEVKEFVYLGYHLKRNGKEDAHLKERAKKGNVLIRQVWGLGERRLKQDYRRRMLLFDYLVASVLLYGAEIWGWKSGTALEGIQDRYIRWTLGLDRCTPGYIVLEETKRDRLGIKAGARAVRFEEKIRKGEGRLLLRECLRERDTATTTEGQRVREEFFRRHGYSLQGLALERERGKNVEETIEQRARDQQRQTQRESIEGSRYNPRYKECITVEIPRYLVETERNVNIKAVARARCGNEEERNRYWLGEERRNCSLCEGEPGSFEHLLVECPIKVEGWGGVTIADLLDERGKNGAMKWLGAVNRERCRLGKERDREVGEG